MFKVNVITQLIMFLILAIIINQLPISALLGLSAIFIAILMYKRINQFVYAFKRFRWLFMILLIVFSFNTPGEHIQGWPFYLSPTYEGLMAGITQMLRIIVVLATITWILAINTKQQLISGFYFIFSPLTLLGLKVERFSARLWLTLHYVELERDTKDKDNLIDRLKNITTIKFNQELAQINEDCTQALDVNALDVIEFNRPKFQLIDYAVIAISLIFTIWVFL